MTKELKSSSERVGQLYPILVDFYGNIIDGEHRFSANKKWMRVTLEHIKTDKDRLVARIVSNNARRTVPRKEKRELLGRLGEIYFKQGIEPGKIAYEIAEQTGMSYQWVAKYLPDDFKDSLQSARAKTALQHGTKANNLDDLPKDTLSIRIYANTNFVNILLRKPLYKKLEEKAKRLETTPDKLIYNAILQLLKA